jgi:hypothetical protein
MSQQDHEDRLGGWHASWSIDHTPQHYYTTDLSSIVQNTVSTISATENK